MRYPVIYRALFGSTSWPDCPSFVQEHLTDVLPSILDGLADEAEGVRDAALAAGRTFVDLYAETALPLLLPAVEDGILNDNWRIRQSSVELLGQLLFKVPCTLTHTPRKQSMSLSYLYMLPCTFINPVSMSLFMTHFCSLWYPSLYTTCRGSCSEAHHR